MLKYSNLNLLDTDMWKNYTTGRSKQYADAGAGSGTPSNVGTGISKNVNCAHRNRLAHVKSAQHNRFVEVPILEDSPSVELTSKLTKASFVFDDVVLTVEGRIHVSDIQEIFARVIQI